MATSGVSRLRFAKAATQYSSKLEMLPDLISVLESASVEKIFYVRMDAIGDAVLSSRLLYAIHLRWPKASITIACQGRVLELYDAAPFKINFIVVDPVKARLDQQYLGSLCAAIAKECFDLALCPVYSREVVGDVLIGSTGASIRVGHQGDFVNQSAQDRLVTDGFYTHLVSSSGEWLQETKRHEAVANALGLDMRDSAPLVWTRPEDVTRAAEIIESNGLVGKKILSFYPGAQHQFRVYEKYQPVLHEMATEGWSIIGFGTKSEFSLVNGFLLEIPGSLNLCGETSVTVAAELLRKSALGLGSESSLSHIACAVELSNVVILGGGHYGRFCPISRFTVAVVLPLNCFRCNWLCRFGKSYCVQEIHPGVVLRALDVAQAPSDFPRIVKDLVRPKSSEVEVLLDRN